MLDLPIFFPPVVASGPGGNGAILEEAAGYVLQEDDTFILIE
jgi:hypothetical protein